MINGEKFLLNAELAGAGVYDQDTGKLAVNVAANTMNLQWRDTVLNVMDFDTDLTNDGADIRTFSALTGNGALQAAGRVSFDGGYDIRGPKQIYIFWFRYCNDIFDFQSRNRQFSFCIYKS